jgi:thiamine-monophosphate kinase
LLQDGRQPDAGLAERFHTPSPRVALGRKLSERQLATAMLDISDGLLADLGHILDASGVGAELELDKLPLSQSFQNRLKHDPNLIDFALAGGEDYELVFTSVLKDLAKQPDLTPAVTRIGMICREPGIRLRLADGELYQCQRGGFDHFV